MSQKCNIKEHERRKVDTDGRKLLSDVLNLVGIVTRDRVPNYRGIFSLDRTNIKYSMYKHSGEGNLKLIELAGLCIKKFKKIKIIVKNVILNQIKHQCP
jgi:hypothetical protein